MGKEMSKILPGLYLGRLDNAQNDNDMMANCITHVLSVHEPVKQKLQKFKSYEYFEVNVKDEEFTCISKYFCKTNDFIHDARIKNGNVLIHCLAGVSRAPTIVLAYLMTVYELNFQDAYNCLRAVRPNIKPNSNFIKQLNDFEASDVIMERTRLFETFGIYQNIEEDRKSIRELLAQYENRDTNDYYIGNSLDSSFSDQHTDLGFKDLVDNDIDCGTDDDLLIDFLDQPEPASRGESEEGFNSNSRNNNNQTLNRRLGSTTSPTPDQQSSDVEEEIDIPGSIPIGGGALKDRSLGGFGTSSSDYRGRAHSRQSQAASALDTNPSILTRYGQTAPPSLPMMFLDNRD